VGSAIRSWTDSKSAPCPLLARHCLFNLASCQELVPLDQSTELSDNRSVFADVIAKFSELGVLFGEPFHVLDGSNVPWSEVGFRLVHLDLCLGVRSEVPERGQVMRLEERVLIDSVTSYESHEEFFHA